MHIFRRIFFSNYWWQESDIWSQASYRYAILWEVFLDPSYCYFLFADLVGFYTHWAYMHIFCHIFLSNYWWQRSDIWLQASYRYPISWEAFLDLSDSYFLLAEEWRYHKWALAHSSSCFFLFCLLYISDYLWTWNASLSQNWQVQIIIIFYSDQIIPCSLSFNNKQHILAETFQDWFLWRSRRTKRYEFTELLTMYIFAHLDQKSVQN